MSSVGTSIIFVMISFVNALILPTGRMSNQSQPQNSHFAVTPQTCPCVQPKGSSLCVDYDSRFQASTLDEAMFTFIDLSTYAWDAKPMFTPTKPKISTMSATDDVRTSKVHPKEGFFRPKSAVKPADDSYTCTTRECQACKLKIIEGFVQASDNDTAMHQLQQYMMHEIGPTGGGGQMHCDKLERKNTDKTKIRCPRCPADTPDCPLCAQKKKSKEKSIIDEMIELLSGAQSNFRQRRQNDNSVNDIQSRDEEGDKVLGVSNTIACDYTRGEALDGNSRWCGLCSLCWTWRKCSCYTNKNILVPSEYFPTYLNEVNCDKADNGCLADFGKCRPVYRSITVLKNFGSNNNPQWQQQTISMVGACECQVETGTPLHEFITR